MEISHREGRIHNEGIMSTVSRSSPMTFQTSYVMAPTEDESTLTFFQANEGVGDLEGRVVAFDDRLISSYTSGDGKLTGCEVLHRMGENRYAVTGTLLSEGRLANLWKLDLVRPVEDSTEPKEG